ncbi:MAG TPA: HAMP domain-containing sensor histidine kinase [Candidatus Limnocylindrales bacterium]|nr:HAMP domain-containing sensor histidine kinase [Candidatus Limnocylindrales bacterium]
MAELEGAPDIQPLPTEPGLPEAMAEPGLTAVPNLKSDAGLSAAEADPAAARESAEDGRLMRRVRWRLVAWSGGSTLVVLIALGLALYVTAATTLESSGMSALQSRVGELRSFLLGAPPGSSDADRSPADFVFGSGGTIVYGFTPSGQVIRDPRGFTVAGIIDTAAGVAADKAGQDVRFRTISVEGPSSDQTVQVPVRQLTTSVDSPALGHVYIQALQDRTSEVRTLDTLLLVLVVGGLVVVLVAVGFGAIYARRALVPIRDSLAGQRTALRRQREFAADASHELRTPLTVIRASVAHLRRHADQPVRDVGDALEDIDAEVGQLTTMVEDLLLLARSDSGAVSLERTPIELDDVAADAAASLRAPAEAHGVRIVVDPEPAPVLGDATRLRQLVTVLLDNAIRHSPPGGEVRITVRSAGGRASLAVEDQGPGIRDEDLPRLFDRFWRAADAPSGGTGLGLAIAKWIADQHGATIQATNRPTGGARFEVDFAARPPAPPATGAPTSAPERRMSSPG